MIYSASNKFKKVVLLTFLAGIAFLLIYACGGSGGGSGGTGSNSGSGATGLYITDDLSALYQQVIATIYKVEFEKSSDGLILTVFEDSQGVTYDLSKLNGVMAMLSNTPVPDGSYNRVLITVGKELILVDNTGTPLAPNPAFAENAWTTCNGNQCVIEITGAVNVLASKNVVLDFDLKQFTYDPVANSVNAKVVVDDDGSDHAGYHKMKDDDYELKGVIQTVNSGTNSFELTVMKAEHFFPNSNIVTVTVNSSTQYGCDDDDYKASCSISSLTNLSAGMIVEIYGIWDGVSSEFAAAIVKTDDYGDYDDDGDGHDDSDNDGDDEDDD